MGHLSVQELELYDPTLLSKPAMLLVNKMDTPSSGELFQSFQEQLRQGIGTQR